jgi:hypothetical protein
MILSKIDIIDDDIIDDDIYDDIILQNNNESICCTIGKYIIDLFLNLFKNNKD